MIRVSLVFLLLFSGFHNQLFAQSRIQSRQYPIGYFRYPLDIPPVTAGTFGELRPNHFHAGLDFKTMQRTGYPVHAVFDGYVSRLLVQFGGFGNAVYITHTNGYTSVYGHIERFSPDMAKIVKDYQYLHQSFEADIKLPPMRMPVCKDDIIAWSGNAGSSQGPHVHFELRDTGTEETINPQLFGLTIPDKVPPAITTIAIYHLDGKPFSENTPRRFIPTVGKSGNYRLKNPEVINLSGGIGFGISTTDMNSTSANHNGVYSIELNLDGKAIYTFAVERFAFDQTHAVNAYIDYPEFLAAHRWIQKCFILPGSKITLYPQSVNRGIVDFDDDATHQVEFIVKDVAGNVSSLHIKVKSNHLNNRNATYKPTGILFHYDQKNEFSNGKVKVVIQPGNLYDDVDFITATLPKKPGAFSMTYRIHNHFTPVHDNYDLWIKPDSAIGKYADKGVIVSTTGINAGGTYQDGYIKAKPQSFGDFYIKLDTVPPAITPLNIRNEVNLSTAKGIFLRISDRLSGIKSYSGNIDGKWVLMEWDYKSRILSYSFNNDIAPGKHKFELSVSDNKNNSSNYTAEFYR
jgi:hypothetical protein